MQYNILCIYIYIFFFFVCIYMYIVIYSHLPHCIPMKYILKSQPHSFIDVDNATHFAHHHDDWPHRCARAVQAYTLRSVLERLANYDWFLWLDCDVIITDVTQRVESILASPLDEATESFPTEPWPLGLQPVVMRNFRFMYAVCMLFKKMERFQLRCHCILPMKWLQNTNDGVFFGALRQSITHQYRSCNLWSAHDVDQCRSMGDPTWSDFAKRWWLPGVEQGISTDFWTKKLLWKPVAFPWTEPSLSRAVGINL